jgi:hypothetical protein
VFGQECNKKLTLSGTFGNTYWSTLRFHVIPCRNQTSNNTCLPQDEIDKYMKGAYFSVRFINYLIDTKNFTNPFSKMLDNDFFVMSNAYYKELNIYFSNIDIVSDTGFLFENEKQRIVQLRNLKEQIDFRTNSNDILRAIIRLSTVRNIYNRKYVKIQRLMADVGGLIKSIFMIAQFIYMFYNTNVLFEYMINIGNDSDSIVEKRNINTIKFTEVEPSSYNSPAIKFNRRQIITIPNKTSQDINSTFNIKWYEALFCLCTKERDKRTLFHNAVSSIKQKMSIETYLKLVNEVEKIRNVQQKNINCL